MHRWFVLALVALVVAAGCSQSAEAPATMTKSEPPKTEAGKSQATTSNNELSINPNAANLNQSGSALKSGK